MSATSYAVIDAVLKDLIDQVPTMAVTKITLIPEHPREGQAVVARIDVAGQRVVFCEIEADGSLHSARVIET